MSRQGSGITGCMVLVGVVDLGGKLPEPPTAHEPGQLAKGEDVSMLIYLAAPLFCEAERAFNLQLAEKLEDRGFAVFLPQRDGVESSKPPWDEMTDDERRQAIFTMDRDKVLEADILLFVLDGRVPDEGACVELGIAYAQNFLLQRDKLLIGLQTDRRGAFLGAKLNPMLYGALETTTDNENDLMVALEAYRHARTEAI